MAHDLRFALRMILSHRWFSAAVVVTLALGIGLNTMIFTLTNAVLLKPVPVPGGTRLVVIRARNLARGDNGMRISLPDFREYRTGAPSIERMEAGSNLEGVLSERGNPPQAYRMELVSSGMFDMLSMRPVLGRAFLPADDKPGAAPVVLLGYGIWKDRYASSPEVIGHAVRVNEKPATIIGVMPRHFMFPQNSDLWMPMVPTADLEKRDNRSLEAFAMLRRGASIAQARTELNGIASRLAAQYPDVDKDIGARVDDFHDRYNGGGIRIIFLLMLAAVGFVLLIACANVANMMLSRTLGRQREMSIRAALGASRWRVARQLLVESVLLSTMGGVSGLALAFAGVHWFDLSTQNVGKPYWIQFTMDYAVFGYFAALCVVSGLLFGMAPALRSSRVSLNEVLKEGARSVGKHRGGWFSSALVVLQFALTFVLLIGAGIFVHSLIGLLEVNKSVPADQIMTARIDFPEDRYKDTDSRQRFYDQLLPKLAALPGVSHVSIASDPPGLGAADREIEIEHSATDTSKHHPQVSFILDSPGYLDTIRLPILLGRDFNQLDGTANHKSAVLTRQCAEHFWPAQNALGKRFRFFDDKNKPGDWITVVGISADMVQELNENDPHPLMFIPFRQEGWNGMALMLQSTIDPTDAVRATVQSLDQDLPLRDVYMLPQAIDHQEWFLHLFTKLFIAFAAIGLVMASVGIYAVIAQATSRRTQEIGVRIALGATVRNILLLVMKRGVWQIGLGLALGIAAAIPATRAMASLSIGLATKDPIIFSTVAAVMALVGLFAIWLPARRAAALDPVKAIRYE
jgi:predicted permease